MMRIPLLAKYNSRALYSCQYSTQIKTGILMMNMGGPSEVGEVNDFLTRLFLDEDIMRLPVQSKLGPFIARRRTPKVAEKYKEIGGGSPILSWTNKQGEKMTQLLDKISPETAPHKHYVGFRYAKPLMENTLDEMKNDCVEYAVAFSQYPQYSCSTSGSSFNSLFRCLRDNESLTSMKWSFIDRWPKHPKLIECFVDLIKKELETIPEEDREDAVLLFSAHALPMKAVNNGDPYPAEVASTVLDVMEGLGWTHSYRLVWQSKVGPVQWLSPQTDDAITGLMKNGRKNIVIVPISFVNEHIETLHELDIEYGKELCLKLGVKNFRRVSAPNDHPAFITALADIVKSRLNSEDICNPQLLLRCPLCTNESCKETKEWISSYRKKLKAEK